MEEADRRGQEALISVCAELSGGRSEQYPEDRLNLRMRGAVNEVGDADLLAAP